MKKILLLLLAICPLLSGCDKDDDDEVYNPFNVQITFEKGRQIGNSINIYSIDNERVPIVSCNIHGTSGTCIALLNTGSYFIHIPPYDTPLSFQIKDKQVTLVKIPAKKKAVIEFKDEKYIVSPY